MQVSCNEAFQRRLVHHQIQYDVQKRYHLIEGEVKACKNRIMDCTVVYGLIPVQVLISLPHRPFIVQKM